MLNYCLKCKKKKKKSKCVICSSKKSRFMKEQEAKGILSSLRLKTSLIEIPWFRDILF